MWKLLCFTFYGAACLAAEQRVFLNQGDWEKYLQEPPEILVVDLSPEMAEVLSRGETMLVNLFDSERLDAGKLVKEKLGPDVEALKSETPDVVAAEGTSSRTRSRAYSDYWGDCSGVYTYTETKNIQRSTSPELLREVGFAVRNVDIDSVERTIEILRMAHRKWTERTGDMIGHGSSRLVREANFAYLERLKDYIAAWVSLQSEMDKVKKWRENLE